MGAFAAANWAEVTGPLLQNVVVPAHTPWTPRYGAAIAVLPRTAQLGEVDVPVPELEQMFFLGGDDFLVGQGGAMHNDVWASLGESARRAHVDGVALCPVLIRHTGVCAEWTVGISPIMQTIFHDQLPRMTSKATWLAIAADTLVPPSSKLTYKEWLCCAVQDYWSCNVDCQFDVYS